MSLHRMVRQVVSEYQGLGLTDLGHQASSQGIACGPSVPTKYRSSVRNNVSRPVCDTVWKHAGQFHGMMELGLMAVVSTN